ncbi:MAG: CPBP family intramembrane metalloprotease [Deltaproteobacteria bacterium]|nr:CPBP family intramembrane metalloprotease [Deltaproteobacteria bacterium]
MDRRLPVIIAVCCIEVAFRAAYDFIRVDPLLYTFLVRAIEMLIIFFLAFKVCGISPASIRKELLIGLGISAVFAAGVVFVDLASRFFLSGGLLNQLIGKQHITNVMGFIIVGCVFGPFVEELFFRGLFYAWLRQHIHFIAAIVLSALIFASMHGFISVVQLIGGLLFAGIYEWRKNIWAPYMVHVLANFGIWVFPWIYPF